MIRGILKDWEIDKEKYRKLKAKSDGIKEILLKLYSDLVEEG